MNARRRRVLVLLTAATLAVTGLLVTAETAQAAITRRQNGAVATGSSGSVTPTLSSASLAGSLLVAVVANGTSGASFSAPAGWVLAVSVGDGCCGQQEIWYYPNNPGGISSATFTASSGSTGIVGELSEWLGAASSSPLDVTGTAVKTTTGTSFSVSTSGAAAAGDVGVTGFNTSGTSMTSFGVGSGWTHLFNDLAGGHVGDYRLNLAAGTITETETSSPAVAWVGAIATFKASTCSGGSLTLGSPTSLAFTALALNGTDRTTTKTLALTPDDETGSGLGWNITGTSTTLTNGLGQTLPTTAVSVTTATKASLGGTCSQPTSSVTYPVTLPAGATPPSAVELYNATAGTGAGPSTVTLTFQLAMPANSFKGTYTSTWTLGIVSGP